MGYSFNHPGQVLRTPRRGHRPGYQVEFILGGGYCDLYFPHIYEPNQSLTDPSGMNPYGRWDFGPWVQPNILAPVEVQAPELKAANPLPGTDTTHPENYLTSCVPESFMDVMMVNGTVY